MDKAFKPQPAIDKTPTTEKKKFTAAIVDTTDLMRAQAVDVGNEKMTITPESAELAKLKLSEKLLKGEFWNRLGQKIWKYGLKRDYNRNKEIYKASQEILKTGNVFVGEGKEKQAHDKVMTDIIDQFTSGYDEAIHEEAGEKKVILGKDELEEEATGDKEAAKQLIKDWATGKISKESFLAQEDRLFHQLKGNQDEKEVKGNVMYASNLFEVAEQVKLAIKNGEFLENEDFEFEMIYGISKASVRTEDHFNRTERVMDKLLHSKLGQFTNETTIAMALSCASSLLIRTAAGLPGKIVPVLGTALISSGFAKKRAEMEEIKKRTADAREKAKGGKDKFNPDTMPVRAEMDAFSYKTESAVDILKNIDTNLQILEKDGANLTEKELNSLFAELTSLEALVRLSDRRSIDLITYSNSTNVVKERLAVDIKKRQMKDALQKAFESGNHKIPNGTFEEYFNSLSTTEENRLIMEKDTGIDAKDRNFNKMKTEKGWKAAKTAFKFGLLFGAAFSEGAGLVQGHTGVVGDMIHTIKGGHMLPPGVPVEHLTMATYIKHLFQGDVPKMDPGKMHEILIGGNHMKLPEGVNMLKNPDGSFNLVCGGKVLSEHLTVTPNGSLTEEAKNILAHSGIGMEKHLIDVAGKGPVSVEDHIKGHPGDMKEILKRVHFDNNTPTESNLNELKTQLGGIHGSGIDANNNFVYNVGHMTPDGSFHGDLSANAQELMKAGHLKMLFSMSNGTQNHVFEFTVTPKGEIIIPPGSEAGKLLFSNVNGHLDFHGRFGEVAQDMGNGQYHILSTIEGKGIKDIIDVIKTQTEETVLNVPGSYDGDLVFIPIVPGDPLEKLEENKKEDKTPVVGPIAIEKTGVTDMKAIGEGDGVKQMKAIGQGEVKKEALAISQFSVGNEFGRLEAKEANRKAKIDLARLANDMEVFKSTHPGEKIPVEMEDKYKDAEANLINSKATLDKAEEEYKKELDKQKEAAKNVATPKAKVEPVVSQATSPDIKKKPVVVKKTTPGATVEPVVTPGKNPDNSSSIEKKFTVEDLSKGGTEIESATGKFTVTEKIKKPGFWSFNAFEVKGIFKDKNGTESIVSYDLKEMERLFKKNIIKITKVENKN